MGVPTSEVGYTTAMPRREDREVHKGMWWHWTKKKITDDEMCRKCNMTEHIIIAAKLWFVKLKGIGCLGDIGEGEKVILKRVLMK